MNTTNHLQNSISYWL